MIITNKILPVVLAHKLGRFIGISTATGDFYDLSAQAFRALEKWNQGISQFQKSPSEKEVLSIAKSLHIPPSIHKLFPFPAKEVRAEIRESPSDKLTDLTLNLTSDCNLRCLYCWNDQGKYTNKQFLKGRAKNSQRAKNIKCANMKIETALKAVDVLVKSKGADRDLVVDFYGGEPLLNLKTLLATVDYCRKNQAKWKVNFHFLLATNGTLLTPQVAGQLLNRGVQIAVSIDGPKVVHDRNRPFIDRSGSFDAVVSNLKKMPKPVMKRLVGRTTVTPFFTDMVKLYEHLKKLGFERIEIFESEDACHKILPVQESSFFASEENYKLLYRAYEKLALRYIDNVVSGRLDYSKTFFNRFFKLMQRLYYSSEVSGGCPAARGQIAVSIDGGIYPCTSFLGIKRFSLGNVERGINFNKFSKFITQAHKRFENCKKECSLFTLCRSTGSCLNVNYFFNADPAVPHKTSCELFAEKLFLATATLAILSEKIPNRLEKLFGFDPVGRRGNKLY